MTSILELILKKITEARKTLARVFEITKRGDGFYRQITPQRKQTDFEALQTILTMSQLLLMLRFASQEKLIQAIRGIHRNARLVGSDSEHRMIASRNLYALADHLASRPDDFVGSDESYTQVIRLIEAKCRAMQQTFTSQQTLGHALEQELVVIGFSVDNLLDLLTRAELSLDEKLQASQFLLKCAKIYRDIRLPAESKTPGLLERKLKEAASKLQNTPLGAQG